MNKNKEKTKLTKASEISTIIATPIAILALFVMICELNANLKDIVGEIQEIRRESQSLQIVLGVRDVHDDENSYVKEVRATHGDELSVQLFFKNTSDFKMDNIGVRIVLPAALEYVSGSTILYNRTNPDGLELQDGITERWESIGGYSPYDGQERGSGSIYFRVRVSEDEALFVPGENILNILGQIGGYADGTLITDTHIYYAAVIVMLE